MPPKILKYEKSCERLYGDIKALDLSKPASKKQQAVGANSFSRMAHFPWTVPLRSWIKSVTWPISTRPWLALMNAMRLAFWAKTVAEPMNIAA